MKFTNVKVLLTTTPPLTIEGIVTDGDEDGFIVTGKEKNDILIPWNSVLIVMSKDNETNTIYKSGLVLP